MGKGTIITFWGNAEKLNCMEVTIKQVPTMERVERLFAALTKTYNKHASPERLAKFNANAQTMTFAYGGEYYNSVGGNATCITGADLERAL